jgi:replication-associated recombination protein RarA
MRLADRYHPESLDQIAGQPAVRQLRMFALEPYPRCLAFEGSAGTGKTSAAVALARALGAVEDDPLSGYFEEKASDFSVDRARMYFESCNGGSALMKLRPMKAGGWNVLVLEELEHLSAPCVRFLKVALDGRSLPQRCVVIATSNDLSRLEGAFRQRFDVFQFQSGKMFADACVDRLCEVWQRETGQSDLPAGWRVWGWEGTSFSMRAALNDMGRTIDTLRATEVAA